MQIDKEAGVIRGVNVIQSGEAEGHIDEKGRQLVIDETTLDQFYDNATKKTKGVKVKANHGNDVLSTVGFLKDFKRNPGKVTADLYLDPGDKAKDKIMWMAEAIPDEFGLSASFMGKDEIDGDIALARCTQVQSADVVDRGAVTTGLFSARINGGYHEFSAKQVDKECKDMTEEKAELMEPTEEKPVEQTLEEKIAGYEERLAAIEEKVADKDLTEVPEDKEMQDESEDKEMQDEAKDDEKEMEGEKSDDDKDLEQDKNESAENASPSEAEVPMDDKELSALDQKVVDRAVRKTLSALGVKPVELGAKSESIKKDTKKNLSTKEILDAKATELGSKAQAVKYLMANGTPEQRKELAQVA